MGAWDVQPWDNDDAADWFSRFFEGIDADARIESAFQHEDDDKYDLMRAASYILQVLGRVYVWPGDVDRLGSHLDRAILELSKMVDPISEAHVELVDTWGENKDLFNSIRSQIEELKQRRSEGNW